MDIVLSLEDQERNLIDACVRKELWAQKHIYQEHYGALMGVCLRYATNKEDALDILHEGYIKIFRNIRKYQPGTSLIAWMRRIMVNTAIDYYRKAVRRRTEDLDQVYDISTDEPDAISRCTEKEILACVQTLSPAYRTVFNLYVIEGYSHREVADQLGITESTSRSNLVKARSKLRALLGAKYKGYGA